MRLNTKILTGAVLALSLTGSAFAQFVSIKTEVVPAVASVGGVPVVDFNMSIRDVVDPLGTPDRPEITWAGVQAGDSWTVASQLLLVNATITNLQGGIQFYTDNTDVTANPRFVDPTPVDPINTDSNPAGLLLDDGSGTSSRAVPLAWSAKLDSKVVGGADPATGIGAADPNTGPDTGAANRFQWLFGKDSGQGDIDNNGNGIPGEPAEPAGVDTNGNGIPGEAGEGTAFVNGDPFVTVVNIEGIHFGQAPTEFGGGVSNARDTFIYLQADFSTALPGQTYRSSQLTVEAFTQ